MGHRNVVTEGRFLAAVKACGDDAVLSHYAGVCLHGWLKYDGRPIDVTAGRRSAPARRSRHTAPSVIERIIVKQIPVTPPLRTIIDFAKHVPTSASSPARSGGKHGSPQPSSSNSPAPASSAASSISPPKY